jgi:hypothetical protein
MVVTKDSDSSVVSAPSWITLCTTLPCPRPAVSTIPSVTINSTNAADEGIYIITLGSKLFNESTIAPSYLSFKAYLHPSPCIKSVLSWGTRKPQDISFKIIQGAVNVPNHFDQVTNSVLNCGLIKYTITPDKVNILNIVSSIS